MWVNSRVFHCSEAEVCNLIRRHCTLSETAYVNWRNTEKEGKVLQGHCGLFLFQNRRYLFFCLLSYTVPGSLRKKNNDLFRYTSLNFSHFVLSRSPATSRVLWWEPSKMHSFQQSRCEIELSLTIQNGWRAILLLGLSKWSLNHHSERSTFSFLKLNFKVSIL